MDKTKFYSMKMLDVKAKTAEITIYGEIVDEVFFEGDTSAISFKEDLDALGEVSTINLYLNSGGGGVFAGLAIYNQLKRHKAKVNVYIDALAASIASVIAMAGDTITMPANSLLMIHQPWLIAMGNSRDLRETADTLDRIGQSINQAYLSRNLTVSEEELNQLMDNETWLSAEEAVEMGFADTVIDSNNAAACVTDTMKKNYKHVPKALEEEKAHSLSAEELERRKRIAAEAKNNAALTKDILGGIYNGNY